MGNSREELHARLVRATDAELRTMCRQPLSERYERIAIEVAREILDARQVEVPGPARCPSCGSEDLEIGHARIHGTALGFLLVGLSHQHLWFRSDETDEEEIALGRHERLSALKCRGCGTLILER